jgi:hypothetical protein
MFCGAIRENEQHCPMRWSGGVGCWHPSRLSPYVHDAMVVLAGGGVLPSQVRQGTKLVAELQREMDRSRRQRLQSLGFEEEEAVRLSTFHTKNFM